MPPLPGLQTIYSFTFYYLCYNANVLGFTPVVVAGVFTAPSIPVPHRQRNCEDCSEAAEAAAAPSAAGDHAVRDDVRVAGVHRPLLEHRHRLRHAPLGGSAHHAAFTWNQGLNLTEGSVSILCYLVIALHSCATCHGILCFS